MRKPYLAHLGTVDLVRVFVVDGTWIRNVRDVDFTNGAHHLTRRYVPVNEVWVDQEAPGAGEIRFLVAHQLHERKLMMAGLDYLTALSRSNRLERRARREAAGGPLRLGEARARVRRELVGCINDDAVWIVDGRGVRDHFDPNFTQGGHHWRYRFIPRREIWIDDAIAQRELEYTLAHEAHELRLMRSGMRYDDAHARALTVEKTLRRTRRFHRPIVSIPPLSALARRA